MNWFKILKYICKDIDSITRNFFCKDNCEYNKDHKPIQSLAWDKICHPKYEGGLGIKKIEDVNAAF